MMLFKYMTERGILKFFETMKLRFSPPHSFNDPFEMKASVRMEASTKFYSNGEPNPWEDGEGHAAADNYLQRMISSKVIPRIGMICLSSIPDDILMWAHYAENHRGAVISFDASHPFFTEKYSNSRRQFLRQVVYSEERVEIDEDTLRHFLKVSGDGGYAELFSQEHPIFYTKSKHWSYESEWRLIRQIEAPSETPSEIWREFMYGGKHYDPILEGQLVSVPSEAIKAVTFGVSSRKWASYGRQSSLEEDIADAIDQNPSLNHVELFKARLNRERFSLKIFNLDSVSDLRKNVDAIEFSNRMTGMMGRTPKKA